MNCIHCGTNAYELKETVLSADGINKFGRREIVYTANLQDNIHWQNDKFHCDKCGKTFTFQEAVSQQKKPVDPQTKLIGV
jgi:predicted nucleic-acid-binding Zn-ribbon protein